VSSTDRGTISPRTCSQRPPAGDDRGCPRLPESFAWTPTLRGTGPLETDRPLHPVRQIPRDWATRDDQAHPALPRSPNHAGNQEVSGRILRTGHQLVGRGSNSMRRAEPTNPTMALMLWAMDMMSIDYSIMFPTPVLSKPVAAQPGG